MQDQFGNIFWESIAAGANYVEETDFSTDLTQRTVVSGGYVLSGTVQIVRTKVVQVSGEIALSGNATTLFEAGPTDPVQIRPRTFNKWHRSFN